MKALITGISGHIGGIIASRLIKFGVEIIGVDRKPPKIEGVVLHINADIGSKQGWANICDEAPECEIIIHAAASIQYDLFATEITLSNCLGTQMALQLAEKWRTRSFIFLSSLPVIGQPRLLPITENHPVDPRTAYHASKLFGEHLVKLADGINGMATTSLRLTSPIGPGMMANRIFSVFTAQALSNKPITLAGSGTRKQNYIDARDIASAVEIFCKNRTSGLFNIAGPKSISNLELAQTCVSALNSSSTISFTEQPDSEDSVDWDVSIEKAVKKGFKPEHDLRSSILDYAATLKEE